MACGRATLALGCSIGGHRSDHFRHKSTAAARGFNGPARHCHAGAHYALRAKWRASSKLPFVGWRSDKRVRAKRCTCADVASTANAGRVSRCTCGRHFISRSGWVVGQCCSLTARSGGRYHGRRVLNAGIDRPPGSGCPWSCAKLMRQSGCAPPLQWRCATWRCTVKIPTKHLDGECFRGQQ